MCNHLAIVLLLELVVVAPDLDLVVRFGVDIRDLVGEVYRFILLLGLLLDLLALEGLVALLMAFEACHCGPLHKLFYHESTVILRRLDMSFDLQSCQVLLKLLHFFLELIILLCNEIIR